jgi:hypothetical protein
MIKPKRGSPFTSLGNPMNHKPGEFSEHQSAGKLPSWSFPVLIVYPGRFSFMAKQSILNCFSTLLPNVQANKGHLLLAGEFFCMLHGLFPIWGQAFGGRRLHPIYS